VVVMVLEEQQELTLNIDEKRLLRSTEHSIVMIQSPLHQNQKVVKLTQ
jgi:hypothetical protein